MDKTGDCLSTKLPGQNRPESTIIGIGDYYFVQRNREKSIVEYNNVITSETTDTALLDKRAQAYLVTEQWDLAKAD